MKKFIILPLTCAMLAATGCTQLLQKSEPAQALVLPAAPIPPVQEPERTAAYYQANVLNFGQPVSNGLIDQYQAYVAQVKALKQQYYQQKLTAYQNLVQAINTHQVKSSLNIQQALYVPAPTMPEAPKLLIPLYTTTNNASTDAQANAQLDVAEIDYNLAYLESKARHYSPVFTDKAERKRANIIAKQLITTLDPYADAPNASYDVLIRAMKANVIARNMDVGTNAAEKSIAYFSRLLKMKPQDPETHYWYGFSLAEGGGFAEGIPHMNIALKAGYQEAYLSIANTYMYMNKKQNAISTLNAYKAKYPSDAATADRLIAEIKDGKRYSVWQYIPQPTLDTTLTTQANATSSTSSTVATKN